MGDVKEEDDLSASLRRLEDATTPGTPDDVVARYASLPEVASVTDFGMFEHNVVVLDTEATGFSFSHDELTQIAAARFEEGRVTEWFVTFVDPGKAIPEDVVHLTGIHDEDVAGAPSPTEALAKLVEFVGDAVVVAHNINFDRTFVTKHPSGYPLLENVWVDSLDVARIALPRLRSHRLIDLVRAFDLPLSTHRADADVVSTCAIFRILLAAVYVMPAPLVDHIAGLGQAGEWSTRVVFEEMARLRKEREGDPGRLTVRSLRRRLPVSEEGPFPDADDVAADPRRGLSYPQAEDIREAFTEDGLLGSIYGDFEARVEQQDMAAAVAEAFAKSENLAVEAGTGVGKSMAYLVPLAALSQKNRVTVGVATKTNSLLDQLVYHELPALRDALQRESPEAPALTFVPLKGFSHYLCLRKAARLVEAGAQMREVNGKQVSQAPVLAALLSFVEQTGYDDMDALKLDWRVLPRKAVSTTSHECLRRRCPFYGTGCFVHGQRRLAQRSNVVVTNHSLLFCDVKADGGLLPPIRYWVVDEAHGAEAEARGALSVGLEAEELNRAALRAGSGEPSRNVFLRAERRVSLAASEASGTLFFALSAKARQAGESYASAAQDYAAHMRDLSKVAGGKKARGYEVSEIWVNDEVRDSPAFLSMASHAKPLREAAERLVRASQDLVAFLEDVEGAAEAQRDIAALALDVKEQLNALDLFIDHPSEKYVYSATVGQRKDRAAEKQEALLVEVGPALNETLYARTHSVVFTSATLSVDGSCAAFERSMGLNEGEHSRAKTIVLPSSYDFDNNMIVYVVSDMPEPNDLSYLPKLKELLVATHRAQRGSMLTLFTNRRDMENCFKDVQPALKRDDLRLVCQKWGVSVKGLRDDFLADEHLSLFALKSFWEGFDAPGSTLRGVIIPKLPFSRPTDPLSCERARRDDAAWRKYVLPQAILETKQAAGRLIRKADDKGVLILADRRLLTKSYGKAFLRSMPSKTVKALPASEIVRALELLGQYA